MSAGRSVAPNAYDVRIECDACRVSWTGSTARAFADAHRCAAERLPAPTPHALCSCSAQPTRHEHDRDRADFCAPKPVPA